MDDVFFYMQLGLHHVLDFSAYDHILFLAALALPFTFKDWKKVVLLATFFTIAHCTSLLLSVYGIVVMDVGLIEFLIPVTILSIVLFNFLYRKAAKQDKSILLHVGATLFFGLIHGFGFSNYFNMLLAEEEEKFSSLLSFALGIEFSQVILVLSMLFLAYVFLSWFKVKPEVYTYVGSSIIFLIAIPMLINTFPW